MANYGRSGADKGPTRGQGVHFLSNQTVFMLTLTHISWTGVVIHRPIMRQSLQADLDLVEVANHYGMVWYAAAGHRRALHSNTASAAWLGAVLYSIKANSLRIVQRSSKKRKKDPHPSAPSHAFFFLQISLSLRLSRGSNLSRFLSSRLLPSPFLCSFSSSSFVPIPLLLSSPLIILTYLSIVDHHLRYLITSPSEPFDTRRLLRISFLLIGVTQHLVFIFRLL